MNSIIFYLLHSSEKWERHEGIHLQEDQSVWARVDPVTALSFTCKKSNQLAPLPTSLGCALKMHSLPAVTRCTSTGQQQWPKASNVCSIYLFRNHPQQVPQLPPQGGLSGGGLLYLPWACSRRTPTLDSFGTTIAGHLLSVT